MVVLIDDETVRTGLDASDAVRWMGEAVDAHHAGRLLAPARVAAELSEGRLVFTTGRLVGSWFGYRSYDTFGAESGQQLVVVHDENTGNVRAIAIGNELGRRRVGAIGGVAIDALAPLGANSLGIIGTGRQAACQLWAAASVRQLRNVRVYSRDARRRREFAAKQTERLGVECVSTNSGRDAVAEADIVVLATSSDSPVVNAAWLRPGAYVATLGPKQLGRSEFGIDLAEAASTIVTDSPVQLNAYDPPNILAGTAHQQRLVSLGAVRANDRQPTISQSITLFCSVGLAGTEAYLLERIAATRASPR
jgi:ornithine cyclodeaminase/alanine dehydrogenase-like protein (mu-crystallin family)